MVPVCPERMHGLGINGRGKSTATGKPRSTLKMAVKTVRARARARACLCYFVLSMDKNTLVYMSYTHGQHHCSQGIMK